MSREVICPKCKRGIEVRWGIFAMDTLNRHIKREH